MAVLPVAPLLQVIFIGAVPPVTVNVAEPLFPPKQLTFVVATLDVIPQGNEAIVSVYCKSAEHPLAS